jgi:hypothetical protein
MWMWIGFFFNFVCRIQTMSCKLLLNLVDCIRIRSDAENSTEGRELLMRMLEVFVVKFKTIAKIQLPILTNKCKQPTANGNSDVKVEDVKPNPAEVLENALASTQGAQPKEEKSKFGFPQNNNYNVADYRSLVKTLVCGVKTITWGCSACKSSTGHGLVTTKHFQPHETLVFVRLVKWALKALDIYTLSLGPQPTGPQRINQQNVRNKEEKEVLEHFSGVVSGLSSLGASKSHCVAVFHDESANLPRDFLHDDRVPGREGLQESHLANSAQHAVGKSRHQPHICDGPSRVPSREDGGDGFQPGTEQFVLETLQTRLRERLALPPREREYAAAASAPDRQQVGVASSQINCTGITMCLVGRWSWP